MRTATKFVYPQNLYKPQNSLYYCLVLLHNTEVRGFRMLFSKPAKGQNTNSNGKTAKKLTHELFTFKYAVLKTYCHTLTKPIFVAEYINLFWQHQWVFEWVSSYKKLKILPIYVRKTSFIDITSINRFYIYNFYNNPFKRQLRVTQKRKKVTPKNKYATGLPFGFSLKFKKQLNII